MGRLERAALLDVHDHEYDQDVEAGSEYPAFNIVGVPPPSKKSVILSGICHKRSERVRRKHKSSGVNTVRVKTLLPCIEGVTCSDYHYRAISYASGGSLPTRFLQFAHAQREKVFRPRFESLSSQFVIRPHIAA